MRVIGLVTGLVSLGIVAFLGWQVVDARMRTHGLIQTALNGQENLATEIGSARIAMLLAVEDPSFWDNDGTDYGTNGAGWTTLTQSLAKRLYFDSFTPGVEKLELILIARFALYPMVRKETVLNAFLATAYLGEGQENPVTGFRAGAAHWFGKGLSELSDDEWLSLVAMLIAPNALDPHAHAAENAERVARIKRMLAGDCAPSNWSDVWLEGCAGR